MKHLSMKKLPFYPGVDHFEIQSYQKKRGYCFIATLSNYPEMPSFPYNTQSFSNGSGQSPVRR